MPPCRYCFSADGKELLALAPSPEALSEICDVVLRILAASVVHSVRIDRFDSNRGLLINAPTLAYLTGQSQSLKTLSLKSLRLDENQIHVLGAYSRPDLEIKLFGCNATSGGTSALAEVLGRNQGPTSISWCEIDYFVLADGLRGNSRLKILRPILGPRLLPNRLNEKRQVLAIASALRENKGLIELNLHWYGLVWLLWKRQYLVHRLRFYQGTSDTRSLESQSGKLQSLDCPSYRHVPDAGSLGYDESEHVDKHDTFALPV